MFRRHGALSCHETLVGQGIFTSHTLTALGTGARPSSFWTQLALRAIVPCAFNMKPTTRSITWAPGTTEPLPCARLSILNLALGNRDNHGRNMAVLKSTRSCAMLRLGCWLTSKRGREARPWIRSKDYCGPSDIALELLRRWIMGGAAGRKCDCSEVKGPSVSDFFRRRLLFIALGSLLDPTCASSCCGT